LSFSATSLTFSATKNGDTPPAQQVIVTANGGSVFIQVDASGFFPIEVNESFQFTGTATGVITFTPSGSTFGGSGTVIVKGCKDQFCLQGQVRGSPQTINVSYQVVPLSVSASRIDFSAKEGSAPGSQSITLNSSPGKPGWTSSVTYVSGTPDWLSVPSSGLSRPATITLSPSSLPAGVHTANITFSAGGVSLTVPVVAMVHALGLNFVSPYVATTNVAGEVILRGYGLSAIANPQVMFDTTAATAVTVVSDTEIRANHPALASGSYPVTVKNSSQSLPTRAKLVVVDPPTYPFAVLTRPGLTEDTGFAHKTVYDAERRAFYIFNADCSFNSVNNRIERYRFDGAVWNFDFLSLGIGCPFADMTMSPDGTEIIALRFESMLHVDPVALAITTTVSPIFAQGQGAFGLVGMANDGGAVAGIPINQKATYCRYDVLLRECTPLNAPSDIGTRNIYSTGDGTRLVLAKPVPEPTSNNLYYYDSSTGRLVATPILVRAALHAGVSRTGSRVAISKDYFVIDAITVDRIFDGQFNLLGTLPLTATLDPDVIAMAPDGNRAYRFVEATSDIHIFDLTKPDGLGGFTELPSIAVTVVGSVSEMLITPDGGTLFLVSSQQVLVIPAP